MLAGSIPKAVALSTAVLTATICCLTISARGRWLSSLRTSQLCTVRAFIIVSAVVKVLETMHTNVVSGSRPANARFTSTGSTLARKRRVRPTLWAAPPASLRSASNTNSGPRYDPPMPMLTTLVMGLPVHPFQAPVRTAALKLATWRCTACTSFATSTQSAITDTPLGARSEKCNTLRSSVELMCTPWLIFCIFPVRSASLASSNSISIVFGCTDCRLKSITRLSVLAVSWEQRSESFIRSRKWQPAMSSEAWSFSFCQIAVWSTTNIYIYIR